MNKLRHRLRNRADDSADAVQTTILIAGLTIVAVICVFWLSGAILNKGAEVAACVEVVRAPSMTDNDSATESTCTTTDHSADDHSIEDTSEYHDRYDS